jgi:hypothetical protein
MADQPTRSAVRRTLTWGWRGLVAGWVALVSISTFIRDTAWARAALDGLVAAVVAAAAWVSGLFDGMRPLGALAIAVAAFLLGRMLRRVSIGRRLRSFDLPWYGRVVRVTIDRRTGSVGSGVVRCGDCNQPVDCTSCRGDGHSPYRWICHSCETTTIAPLRPGDNSSISVYVSSLVDGGEEPWSPSWAVPATMRDGWDQDRGGR